MRQKPLTLDNLRELDFGKIGAAFQAELQHVVKDCQDRPTDDRARSVSIVFKLAPEVDVKAGVIHADVIEVGCEITSNVPKRRTQIYKMKPQANGTLLFHPELPEEPEGSTLYDEETGEVK
jgi:hypothetical protein